MTDRGLMPVALMAVIATPGSAQTPVTELLVRPSDSATAGDLEALRARIGAQPVRSVAALEAEIWRVPQDRVAAFLQEAGRSSSLSSADYLAGDYRSLFVPMGGGAELGPAQEQAVAALRQSGQFKEVSVARLRAGDLTQKSLMSGFGRSDGLAAAGSFLMKLGPGRDVIATRRQLQPEGPTLQWSGKSYLVGSGEAPGIVALTVENDRILGLVTVGSATYTIRPLGGGVHAIAQLDPAASRPDHPDEPSAHDSDETEDEGRPLVQIPRPATPPVVSVAVAYTTAAANGMRQAYGSDPSKFVELLETFTNRTFEESDAYARIKIVGSKEVSLSEGWDMAAELQALVGRDKRFDEVHDLRRSLGANAVMLLVNIPTGSCGKSAAILPPSDASFAIVDYQCAGGSNFSFAHELGHLFGARHDKDPKDYPFTYGRGYRYKNDFRTIMAYPGGECVACPRVPRWANPSKLWNGIPMGTSTKNHDARAISETAPILSTYKPK